MSQMNDHFRGFRLSAWVAVLVLGGLWGCSRGPSASQAERLRHMEARIEQLVADFQVVAEARDQARERVLLVEQQLVELVAVQQERDRLRVQLAQIHRERDLANSRCEKLRKGFLNLMSEDDTLAAELQAHPIPNAAKGMVPAITASGSSIDR